jgi:hypothetical protein
LGAGCRTNGARCYSVRANLRSRVSVITTFEAAESAVTAKRCLTWQINTGIRAYETGWAAVSAGLRHKIRIIALLASLKQPISAGRKLATVRAGVIRNGIAVVALLSGLDKSITATRSGAVCGAAIRFNPVSVITGLTRLQESVAAARKRAAGGAPVRAKGVAIVAGFARLHEAIAAAAGGTGNLRAG